MKPVPTEGRGSRIRGNDGFRGRERRASGEVPAFAGMRGFGGLEWRDSSDGNDGVQGAGMTGLGRVVQRFGVGGEPLRRLRLFANCILVCYARGGA